MVTIGRCNTGKNNDSADNKKILGIYRPMEKVPRDNKRQKSQKDRGGDPEYGISVHQQIVASG